jgi:hypothetical protein
MDRHSQLQELVSALCLQPYLMQLLLTLHGDRKSTLK